MPTLAPTEIFSPTTASDDALTRLIGDRVITDPADRRRWERSHEHFPACGLTDYWFVEDSDQTFTQPEEIFPHLRWGGQIIFTSTSPRKIEKALNEYRVRPEFHVETQPQQVTLNRRRWFLFPYRQPHYYFVARKTRLINMRDHTDRHSYDVQLSPDPEQPERFVVLKKIPTYEHTLYRLTQRFPDASPESLERSARKLVKKVFPLFLTREAAMLMILERKLPASYRAKFPWVVSVDKDDRGMVRQFSMRWLRLGGGGLTHLEFARQSAQLLHILHEVVGVIHLDLRLDNFVVTENGVGFVDFGSAVRVGEDITHNDLLNNLFSEMLSASQVQQDLGRLLAEGKVTSSLFTGCHRKIDKAVDLFYLVLQMHRPLLNPDLRGLVEDNTAGAASQMLTRLRHAVLVPPDPANPRYSTARDVLKAIVLLNKELKTGRPTALSS